MKGTNKGCLSAIPVEEGMIVGQARWSSTSLELRRCIRYVVATGVLCLWHLVETSRCTAVHVHVCV